MNQVFDTSRFGLLVRKHWGDNRGKYLLSLGAIASLLLLWYGFLNIIETRSAMQEDGQIVTYYVGLFITGSLYASLLFSDLANKPKAINFLAVPAAQLEKVLVMILYSVFIFFVCYTVIFYLVDFLMVKLNNAIRLASWEDQFHEAQEVFTPREVANVFYRGVSDGTGPHFDPLAMAFTLFFGVQGAYALGSIYFPAYSFIKTTIALLLLALLYVLVIAKVLYPILPQGYFDDGLTSFYPYGINDPNSEKLVEVPGWVGQVVFGFFRYVLAPAFWVITYFRLKEKEV
ncbi:hypothetical protein [Paraflavitalea pollutisoli]|uniref:hypothetical protein n=1 Tax=Paraflavitalea pollutisoli TaxID=3034143 RepID=UPI0023ED398C|nr:hypothetical protein [Paraflavitalea sp. H1-2-19X]